MISPRWRASITLGTHSWSLTQDTEKVDDDLRVLDGLTFGWASGPLWPVQPDPMTASLGLNVPNFADVADLAEGDPVAIEVALGDVDDEGMPRPVWASFYGRVTDLQAVPRPGRHGVLLQITAVDYAVDVAEAEARNWTGEGEGPDYAVVNAAFIAGCGGPLEFSGPFPSPPDLWTGPDGVYLLPPGGSSSPKAAIDAALFSAVTVNLAGDGPQSRMLLSPLVDSDGLLPTSGRAFTLDTLDVDTSDVITPDGDQIARDINWTRVKGDNPNQLIVTYNNGALPVITTRAGAVPPYCIQQIDTWLGFDESSLIQGGHVGVFYMAPSSPWQVKSFPWLLDALDDDTRVLIPPMFPNWKADEGDPARWRCYTAQVTATHLDPSCTPDGATTFTGRLVGASLTIAAGRLTIIPAVRLA